MIDKEIFDRILKIYSENKDKITQHDILAALTEELGEYSRATRVEDDAPICHNKIIKESSIVEIIDLMLVCIEAFISRGGLYFELKKYSKEKLDKWEELWNETNTR